MAGLGRACVTELYVLQGHLAETYIPKLIQIFPLI